MRLAFLIISHRSFPQLLRLLGILSGQMPGAPLVVHHDQFHEPIEPSVLTSMKNVHLLTPENPTSWGDFSILNATWRSIAWSLGNIDFEWLVMLSAQDYPIRPLHTLSDYLAETGADVLLRSCPIDRLPRASERREMRRRYLYQYGPASARKTYPAQIEGLRNYLRMHCGPLIDALNIAQPLLKIYAMPSPLPYRFGWHARSTPFTKSEPCWFGDARFSLSRRAAEYIVSVTRKQPDFVDYFSRTVISAEGANATLLCNAKELCVKQGELHYTRWTNRKEGHPDIFALTDIDELISSGKYFARKFDIMKDALILDRLDSLIRQGDLSSA